MFGTRHRFVFKILILSINTEKQDRIARNCFVQCKRPYLVLFQHCSNRFSIYQFINVLFIKFRVDVYLYFLFLNVFRLETIFHSWASTKILLKNKYLQSFYRLHGVKSFSRSVS